MEGKKVQKGKRVTRVEGGRVEGLEGRKAKRVRRVKG